MLRGFILVCLLAGACAPAPTVMPATQASELLERFAAGVAPGDVCTPEGRALLRGAVRAYGAEMAQAGVNWPTLPATDRGDLNSVDVAVLVAFAAGFVEASDFRGRAQGPVARMSFAQWPEIDTMRRAARVACAEVAVLQQAAARFVLEAERYRRLTEDARKDGGERAAARLSRQAGRLQRAHWAMLSSAAFVEQRLAAALGG